ncbi:MAG: ABC transporter permease, partial [Bryobacteraceae bacterium]
FTLALAIGANTTVFSFVDALLLRPFPGVRQPDQLVSFADKGVGNQSYPNYVEFRDRTKAFSGLTAFRVAPMNLSFGTGNERAWGYEATGNYFQVLGVRPALGRFFTPAEDQNPGGDPYAVLSYSSWQRWFGGNPDVVNRTIKINGLSYTILGIAPKGFIGTELLYVPDIWVPMSMEARIEPGSNWLNERGDWNIWVLGRIRAGVSHAQAQSDVDAIAAQLAREYPRFNEGMRVYLAKPGLVGGFFRGPITGFLAVVMGVAGLVLLIACVNLASFLLARSTDRRKETAIRIALGAGRIRLIRQLLTESLLLAIAGGAAGLFIAWWATDLISRSRIPIDVPINTTVAIDPRVLAFAILASVLTVLFFGLAPALQATRPDVAPALKNQAWSRRLRRWELRDVFVAAQVALSVVLLAASVLVVRSLQNALTVNIGFNPKHAASVAFDLGLQGYSEAQGRQFQRQLLQRVQALPGVESATIVNSIPLTLGTSHTTPIAYGRPVPKPSDRTNAIYY